MNIYHAHGQDCKGKSFSFVVRAQTELAARLLVRDVLTDYPVVFVCTAVGLAFKGETDESIVW